MSQESDQITLSSYFKSTLSNELNTQSLKNLEKIEQINKRIQQTTLFPSLTLNSSFNQYNQNSSISYNDNLFPTSKVTNARSSLFSGSITTSIDIVRFGQNIYGVRGAKLGIESKTIENIQQRNELIIQTAEYYTNCIMSQLTEELFLQRMNDSRTFLEIAQVNLSTGRIDSAQYLMSFINFENDKIAYKEVTLSFSQLEALFLQFIGKLMNEGISFSSMEGAFENTAIFETLDSKNQSIDLKKMQVDINELRNNKVRNYFNFFPSVSVFGGYSFSDQKFQNGIFAENMAFGLNYGVGFSYSFGQFKNAEYQNKIHNLNIENSQLEMQNKIAQIKIRNNHLKMERAMKYEKYEGKKIIVIASSSYLKKIKIQYKKGTISITDVRNAQNQLFSAEIELAESLKERLMNNLNRVSDYVDITTHIIKQ
jgi:outer membrane protein TolC